MTAPLSSAAPHGGAGRSLLDALTDTFHDDPKRVRDELQRERLQSWCEMPLPDAWASASLWDALDHVWALHRYPYQTPPPGSWSTWAIIAGRGAGKGRAGAEWLVSEAERASRLVAEGRIPAAEARLGAIAATASDVRKTLVEGPSGLLRCNKPWFAGEYQPTATRVAYPNGVEVHLYSAEEPDRLRGPNFRALWMDEFCAWRFPDDALANAMFALRLGDARALITTTPRPSKLLRQILEAPTTVVTRGATRDNIRNLASSAVERLYREFEGTRLGRQELFGEILEDNPGALWRVADIDGPRVTSAPELRRVVVAIDPAVTSREDSDETAIVVAGIGECRCAGKPDTHAFVLEDLSGIFTPDQWARRAAEAFSRHKADRVVAEVNQGGDLVEATLRTVAPSIPFTAVHATRGKQLRAEPIAALYEQHRVHHVGHLPTLESQLVQWDPLRDRYSPDRLDALVWALTSLDLGHQTATYESWTSDKAAPVEILRRHWMGIAVAPVKDWTIDATMIRAAAQLANASETDVKRVALGLPPAIGERAQIFEALVAAGADRGLLDRLARTDTAKEKCR